MYLDPPRVLKRLKIESYASFLWPLILGGLILGLAVELRNLNSGVYIGMTLMQGILYLLGSMLITLVSFIIFIYFVPLLLYRFEFMLFKVKDGMKRLAFVLALLAPLYGSAVLVRVVLDILLPEHWIFKFIELALPAIAQLYALAILFVAIRNFFKLANVKAIIVTALPWLFMLVYNII